MGDIYQHHVLCGWKKNTILLSFHILYFTDFCLIHLCIFQGTFKKLQKEFSTPSTGITTASATNNSPSHLFSQLCYIKNIFIKYYKEIIKIGILHFLL